MKGSKSKKSEGASFEEWFVTLDNMIGDILGGALFDMIDYSLEMEFEDDRTPEETIPGIIEYWNTIPGFGGIVKELRKRQAKIAAGAGE